MGGSRGGSQERSERAERSHLGLTPSWEQVFSLQVSAGSGEVGAGEGGSVGSAVGKSVGADGTGDGGSTGGRVGEGVGAQLCSSAQHRAA